MTVPEPGQERLADIRHIPDAPAAHVDTMPSADLRAHFLIDDLFEPGRLRLRMTGLDRLVVGGAIPVEPLQLPSCPGFGTPYFTQRREVGVMNLGRSGVVTVGQRRYTLKPLDCLYIGCEEELVELQSGPEGPAVFYLLSCPAHRKHPTARMSSAEAETAEIGTESGASRRRLRKYIHPAGLRSCQLMMGFTEMMGGAVWNTMPPHVHSRRSEVYLYFDLNGGSVVHLMGKAETTRSLIVRDRQAVLSPPWSVHFGAGTSSYRFVWGMAGENQDFSDMDPIQIEDLR